MSTRLYDTSLRYGAQESLDFDKNKSSQTKLQNTDVKRIALAMSSGLQYLTRPDLQYNRLPLTSDHNSDFTQFLKSQLRITSQTTLVVHGDVCFHLDSCLTDSHRRKHQLHLAFVMVITTNSALCWLQTSLVCIDPRPRPQGIRRVDPQDQK